jgi:hypothetical protein
MKNYLEQIKELNIYQPHVDLIVGCLLGDATIKGHDGSKKGYLSFGQGLPHKEYLYYLFSIMAEYCIQPEPWVLTGSDPRYPGKEYKSYHFATKRMELLYPFYKLFINETIKPTGDRKKLKVIPACIGELLTNRALAF